MTKGGSMTDTRSQATIRAVLKDAIPEFGSNGSAEIAAPEGAVLRS